jgi:hypothetical protein
MTARDKWLYSILTGIFIVQASTLIYGIVQCTQVTPKLDMNKVCPQLGERFETTFATMIATTLALLTGNEVIKRTPTKPKPSPPKKDA